MIGTLSTALTGAAYAGGSTTNAGSPSGLVRSAPLASPIRAQHASGIPAQSSMRGATTSYAARPCIAIICDGSGPPRAIKGEQVNAPGRYDLEATAAAVTVKWYD